MSWISLTVKDIALGAGPHVMWWLLEGIEPSFDARLSPGGGFRRAAEEKNGRKNDHLEPLWMKKVLRKDLRKLSLFFVSCRWMARCLVFD